MTVSGVLSSSSVFIDHSPYFDSVVKYDVRYVSTNVL